MPQNKQDPALSVNIKRSLCFFFRDTWPPRIMSNPFAHLVEPLDPAQPGKKFFNLNKLKDSRYGGYLAL